MADTDQDKSKEQLLKEIVGLRDRLVQLESECRQTEHEKSIILENVFDLIVYRNRKMETIWASKKLADFLGCSPDQMRGRICYKARYKRETPCDNCWVTKAMETGQIQERVNTSPDGRVWQVTCNPIFDDKGEVIGSVEISQDITKKWLAEEQLQRSLGQTRKLIRGFINAVAAIVETRDPYTAGHQRRVAELAKAIAEAMNLPEEKVTQIYTAAFIHDIGKISVPAEILSKPLHLNDIEAAIMRLHPQTAYNILVDIDFPWPLADYIRSHHERLNGSGYPERLTADRIPMEARIIAVADVVEAMASNRPYRPSFGVDKALDEITKYKGVLYDGDVVDACVKVLREKKINFDD